ncbi:MAG TPA: ferritin [Gemmatimonadales bacterium]|jgi:ferritin|nr:ferritin [Gemmatimonadales bacterium]
MLDAKIEAALNEHLQHELASAYLYLAMAAHFEAANLPGSARWMRKQAREELAHAMKVFDYVADRDGRITLQAIAQPPVQFAGTEDVWKQALANEQKVTGVIGALYAGAQQAGDQATAAMLQWFVTEQVEEEKTVRTILEQVQQIGQLSSAMFFLDRHLGKEAET